MKTIAQVIEWYNKQNETKYHKIEVQIKKEGKVSLYENFYDVSGVSYSGIMLCFYGRSPSQNTLRYFRIDNADIIRSEV